MTEIFKDKIGLSPEPMNDIFEFIRKTHLLGVNSQFKPEDPNDKICDKNIEKNGIESFFK